MDAAAFEQVLALKLVATRFRLSKTLMEPVRGLFGRVDQPCTIENEPFPKTCESYI